MTNRGEGDKRRRDDLIDYTLVIAAYGVGMLDDFNPFVLLLASIWALRIGLFERRGLRLKSAAIHGGRLRTLTTTSSANPDQPS